jgi:hypothetical protein
MSDKNALTTEDLARTGNEPRRQADQPARPNAALSGERGASAAVAVEEAAPPRQHQKDGAEAPLFPEKDVEPFRARWNDIQAGFVDEPRRAVQDADGLVADVMQRLAETFANERATLEHQWDRGDSVTTEDLRVALQRYRSFFSRLLSI